MRKRRDHHRGEDRLGAIARDLVLMTVALTILLDARRPEFPVAVMA